MSGFLSHRLKRRVKTSRLAELKACVSSYFGRRHRDASVKLTLAGAKARVLVEP
jgi:hypothetical protein